VQRLIIQDRALRIAPSTASVKGADHNIGGSCRARLAGRQRTADRQEAGVNDPSAQRPGALPLPTGPPCYRGVDDYVRQPAGGRHPRNRQLAGGDPAAKANAQRTGCRCTSRLPTQPNSKAGDRFNTVKTGRSTTCYSRTKIPSSNNYRRCGGSRNRLQRFIFEFGRHNING